VDYRFDEDQESFRAEMRRWAEKVLAPHYQADDKTAAFRPQLALDMAAMGLTGLRIPEEYGGQDATAVVAGLAAEEVGRADFNAGYLIINTALISDIIVRNATAEQQQAWLPGIAEGTTVPCICITEPGHGTDAASLELKAVPDGDGWLLHGEKTSITLGMVANRA
jgi:cyclohexanecarboxyl-CoA dehydrogenase